MTRWVLFMGLLLGLPHGAVCEDDHHRPSKEALPISSQLASYYTAEDALVQSLTMYQQALTKNLLGRLSEDEVDTACMRVIDKRHQAIALARSLSHAEQALVAESVAAQLSIVKLSGRGNPYLPTNSDRNADQIAQYVRDRVNDIANRSWTSIQEVVTTQPFTHGGPRTNKDRRTNNK